MTNDDKAQPRRGVSPAREVAAAVLVRVLDEEAFAAPALDAALSRAHLDARDGALATELVYGVLRTEGLLDQRLTEIARRSVYATDPRVRAHLLIGAYSIAFLDRVPVFAAVSEAVEGVRSTGDERASGFANAALRELARQMADGKRPTMGDAAVTSAPGWLRGSLRRTLGRSGAAAFLAAAPVPPPIGLCLAKGEDRDAWIVKLQAELGPDSGASITAGAVSPLAILVRGAGDVRRLPGAGSAWIVMEEGAQVVALAAGAAPSDRVLDACAGHGNKTWVFGQSREAPGFVDAADLFAVKLADLRRGPPGAFVRETIEMDWTDARTKRPFAAEGYDLVVVDAPCSGVGTLRRRPEIGRRRTADDLARLADLQVAITRRAATHARDGGRVVYAVCSVLREEAEDVVARLTASDDLEVHLEPAPFPNELGQRLASGGTSFRVLPHVNETDGYFVGSFVVRHVRRGG